MEDEEQSKNNLENPPEREEGLQKPIPAIFKGMSDIKRNVSSGNNYREEDKDSQTGFKSDEGRISEKSKGIIGRKKGIDIKILMKCWPVKAVFIAAVLLFVLQLFLKLSEEKRSKKMLNSKVSQLLIGQKKNQEELDVKTVKIEEMEKKIQKADLLKKAPEKFKEYEDKLQQYEDKLQQANEKESKLAVELKGTKKNTEELRQRLIQAQNVKKKLEDKVTDLQKKQDVLGIRLKRMGIDMDAIGLTDVKRGEKLEANVLVLDAENKLVAIDIGDIEGVKPGMEFNVYKQGELYGRIIIDQVQETVSLGKIVPGIGIGNITEGMKVKMK